MTQQKKTIQLANGTAEEGDRVVDLRRFHFGALRYEEGTDKNFGATWLIEMDDGMTVAWDAEDGDLTKELALAFSITEALEAIEEEYQRAMSIIKKEGGDPKLSNMAETAISEFCDELRNRIQQKRKGN